MSSVNRFECVFLFQPPFATSVLSYVWSLIRLQLSDQEMATYICCLLICPTRDNLIDPNFIHTCYHNLYDGLRFAVSYIPTKKIFFQSRLDKPT